MCAFDCYQSQSPLVTLKGHYALTCIVHFYRDYHAIVNKGGPYYQWTNIAQRL